MDASRIHKAIASLNTGERRFYDALVAMGRPAQISEVGDMAGIPSKGGTAYRYAKQILVLGLATRGENRGPLVAVAARPDSQPVSTVEIGDVLQRLNDVCVQLKALNYEKAKLIEALNSL